MNTNFARIIAIVCGLVAGSVTLKAGEIQQNVERQLKLSVSAGNAEDAQKWAATLCHLRQAELAAEQTKAAKSANKVIATYGNIIRSAPAILGAVERFNRAVGETNPELSEMLMIGRTLLILSQRPLTSDDLNPVADKLAAGEKKRIAEREAFLNNLQQKGGVR